MVGKPAFGGDHEHRAGVKSEEVSRGSVVVVGGARFGGTPKRVGGSLIFIVQLALCHHPNCTIRHQA